MFKRKVSEKINKVLLTEIKKHRKTCKSCGAELKWDSLETECVKCALINAMQSSGNGMRFNIKSKQYIEFLMLLNYRSNGYPSLFSIKIKITKNKNFYKKNGILL